MFAINFKQDWLMRQIEMLVQIIARMVFKKDVINYEIVDETNLSRTDLLHSRLKELLAELKICEAEDLLFANIEEGSEAYLRLAVDFYQTLNKLSDAELEAHDFSRQEIADGLNDFIRKYGITLPEI